MPQAPADQSNAAAAGAAADVAGAQPAQDDGTPPNPYAATNQAHIDWFKQNGKQGDVILVGGKPYTL
jgi:hypothetical protein